MQPLKRDDRRWLQALPGYALRPLGMLPRPMARQGFVAVCNRIFATALAQGELDFLEGRVLRIQVEDARIDLAIRGVDKRLQAYSGSRPPDVSIRGRSHDLLSLVSRREDADTLFFQRRLRMEGNTELGLHVKNFLDAWEPPDRVQVLQRLVDTWLAFTERHSV